MSTAASQRQARFGLSVGSMRLVKLLMFALTVHVFVLPQLGGARAPFSVLGTVNPLLLFAALVLEAAALGVYAWLTQLLLPPGDRPSLLTLFGSTMASTGLNHVVPGGAATTAAANYRLLGGAGVPRDSLGFALGTQAIGSAVVLNVILWVALLVSIPTSGFHPIYATAAAVGAVLISLFSAAVLSIRRGSEAFANRIAGWAGRLRWLDSEKVRSSLLGLAERLDALLSDRKRLRIVITLAAANWLLDAAALWVTLLAFGPAAGIDGLLVAYGLANVMAALPITPGGLGVVEAILIPTLVGFGTATSQASVAVVAYRLVSFWLPIPVGAVCYLLITRANGVRTKRAFRTELNRQVEVRGVPISERRW